MAEDDDKRTSPAPENRCMVIADLQVGDALPLTAVGLYLAVTAPYLYQVNCKFCALTYA